MDANSRTLDTLFKSRLRYVVPMFQRLYVWKEAPQWATLWEDVAEKAHLKMKGVKSNPHYLGALIIEGVKPRSPNEVKRFLIIDGQQRLTTLQLLFCAYRDIARENKWQELDDTVTQYLENDNRDEMEKPEDELIKLWPTTLNRNVFRSVVSAGSKAEVLKLHPLVYQPGRRKAEPRSNLVDAYLYFSKMIAEWIIKAAKDFSKLQEEMASLLLKSLQQDFCVVEISLSDGDDSQEIFYSLNSQGKPLSQSDLLRSLIFMRAEKEHVDRDELFANYWSKFETDFWSKDVKRAGGTISRLDMGLRYFLMVKTGQLVNARRVNEEYKRWVSTPLMNDEPRYPTVKEELTDFTRYCDAYQRYESVVTPADLPSTDLRRILLDFDISTALPLILFLELEAGLDEDQAKDCLSTVESFIARRFFIGEETKAYNSFFVEVVRNLHSLRGKVVLPALREKLLAGGGTTRSWPSDNAVVQEAIRRPVSNVIKAQALRLILERLETHLRNKKSESTEIPAGLQIEHVMSLSWADNWPLYDTAIPVKAAMYPHLAEGNVKYLENDIEKRNMAIRTLGNLTLVNSEINAIAGNAAFTDKVIEYKDSVLHLNRYFDDVGSWDEKRIAERGKFLGDMICEIWPRPDLADTSLL